MFSLSFGGNPFELGSGSGVFIGDILLKSIHIEANEDPFTLFRKLLDHMFGEEILASIHIKKTRKKRKCKAIEPKCAKCYKK